MARGGPFVWDPGAAQLVGCAPPRSHAMAAGGDGRRAATAATRRPGRGGYARLTRISVPCTQVLSPMSLSRPATRTFTLASAASFGQRPFGA